MFHDPLKGMESVIAGQPTHDHRSVDVAKGHEEQPASDGDPVEHFGLAARLWDDGANRLAARTGHGGGQSEGQRRVCLLDYSAVPPLRTIASGAAPSAGTEVDSNA